MKLGIVLFALAACSHGDPDRDAKMTRALEGLGDQFAADARNAMAHPPKSRVGITEVLAEMTPDGLPRQGATLAKFGVTPLELANYLHDHPDAIDHMLARAEPAVEELLHALAPLPTAEPGDCDALDRKVAVLAKGSPVDVAYSQVLAAALPPCAGCLGSGDHASCGSSALVPPPDSAN
jgi:hypothetical protein